MAHSKVEKINQNYLQINTVRPLLSAIEVMRPANGEFFRLHPDPDYSFSLLILQNPHTTAHVVMPHLEAQLAGIAKRKKLFTVITSFGEIKLMPVLESYNDNWSKSAHHAAEKAKMEWIQMTANRPKRAYTLSSPSKGIAEPIWPNVSPAEIFHAAFGSQHIEDMSHPLVCQYRKESQK